MSLAGKCQGALHCHSLKAFDGKDVVAIIGLVVAVVVVGAFVKWLRS